MVRPLPFFVLFLAAAFLAFSPRPAGAAWKVRNPQFQYNNCVNWIMGTEYQATAEAWSFDGQAHLKLTLWGARDAEAHAQHYEIKFRSWSRQQFKLDLYKEGATSGPPPTTCPQQARAQALLCHEFFERNTVVGNFNVDTQEIVGNLGDSCWPYLGGAKPPTYKLSYPGNYDAAHTDTHVKGSTTLTSQTPVLNMSIDWHPVNFVKVVGEGWITAVEGKVEAYATACMMDGATVIWSQP